MCYPRYSLSQEGLAMPEVLNMRTLNNQIPVGAVYIGRGRKGEFNKWGNPFAMRSERDRNLVIRNYRDWIMDQPELIAAAKAELVGKDLVCFCSPKDCHGHILIEIANS